MRCKPSSENITVSGATCSTQGEKASASSRRFSALGQLMQANMKFHRFLSGGLAGGDFVVDAAQKFGAAAAGFDQQSRAGFRYRAIGEDHEDGRRRLHDAAETEPCCRGNAVQRGGRN